MTQPPGRVAARRRTGAWARRGLLLAVALAAFGGPAGAVNIEDLKRLQETGDCAKCYLRGAELAGAQLTGADLRNTVFYEADLRGADLRKGDLSKSDLGRAVLMRADLSGAKLRGVDLTRADLLRARLVLADLSGANLGRADLMEADLVAADLSGADLSGANLSKAILFDPYWGAAKGLTQGQLDKACGDAETRLPRGLTLRPCE